MFASNQKTAAGGAVFAIGQTQKSGSVQASPRLLQVFKVESALAGEPGDANQGKEKDTAGCKGATHHGQTPKYHRPRRAAREEEEKETVVGRLTRCQHRMPRSHLALVHGIRWD